MPDPGGPVVLTADTELLDDLLRLAAAAHVEVTVAESVTQARAYWSKPRLILVGADLVADLAELDVPRRSGLVVVAHDPKDEVWRAAVRVGAQEVTSLPDGEDRLVDLLAEAVEPAREGSLTVGVVGGKGGAGASVVAAALAVTASRRGCRALLVDADPMGGGLDLLLGQEQADGARWPDLVARHGRLSCAALAEALPQLGDLAVLSTARDDPTPIPASAMRAVIAAGQRGYDVVVVDLPRHLDEAGIEALARGDVTVLVVPAQVRAVVAAGQVVTVLRRHVADVRLAVREVRRGGVSADTVAGTLGLPLAGRIPSEPGLDAALDRGDPPGGGRLAAFCAAFLDATLPAGVPA